MFLGIQYKDINGETIEHIAHVSETFDEMNNLRLSAWVETEVRKVFTRFEIDDEGKKHPVYKDVERIIPKSSGYIQIDSIRETDEEYIFFKSQWVVFTPEVFEEMKAQKLEEINMAYTQRAELPKIGTPQIEVETWDIQKLEAEGWEKDNSSPTPFIDRLALSREMDRTTLIAKVLEKATAYRDYIGTLTGTRQKYEDAIKSTTTREQLNAITWQD